MFGDVLLRAPASRRRVQRGRQPVRAKGSWLGLEAERTGVVARALAKLGKPGLALDLASKGAAAADPELARERAMWAMRLGRHAAAVAAADVAIKALLHDGLDVERFVELSLRGSDFAALMRVERDAVVQRERLHGPIALRWEALRRSGRKQEAQQMRALCIEHFPDRASVWEAAGNQALDDDEINKAEGYFGRCLALDANWPGGLAGQAIVLERRKDWQGALRFREQLVRQERALERDDPASLQRVIRYAAALARVGRWQEAGALLRRCVLMRAFERLPSERPVLLRVFTHEQYSPAVTAMLRMQVPAAVDPKLPEVGVALREAAVLGRLYSVLQARADLAPSKRLVLLGLCAWLAGDEMRAYALLDEAEVHEGGAVAIQCLLACSAAVICASELPSIVRYAHQAASALLQADSAEQDDEERLYARITLARFRLKDAQPPAPSGAPAGSLCALYDEALAQAGKPLPELTVPEGPLDVAAQLRRLVAFRSAQLAAGRPALETARASAPVMVALERALQAQTAPPTGPRS